MWGGHSCPPRAAIVKNVAGTKRKICLATRSKLEAITPNQNQPHADKNVRDHTVTVSSSCAQALPHSQTLVSHPRSNHCHPGRERPALQALVIPSAAEPSEAQARRSRGISCSTTLVLRVCFLGERSGFFG